MENIKQMPSVMAEPSCTRVSDFAALLVILTDAVNQTFYLSDEVCKSVNAIKSIPNLGSNDAIVNRENPTGVIGFLYEEIYKLQDSNAKLNILVEHLRNIVG